MKKRRGQTTSNEDEGEKKAIIEIKKETKQNTNVKTYRRLIRKRTAIKSYLCFVFILIGFLLCYLVRKEQPPTEKSIKKPTEILYPNIEPDVHAKVITSSKSNNEDSICQPLVPWENTIRPNCNTLHEFNMMEAQIINHGYIRSVWKVRNGQQQHEQFALKTLMHNDRSFSKQNMENQAQDAVISDQLTSSDFVANVYGYCGYSGLYDLSFEGSLEDNYKSLGRIERLQIAVDISKGLADLHDLGAKGHSAIIHNDIAIRQFISIHGRYRLNDFNTVRFIHWNDKEQAICPDVSKKFIDKNRSPEEMRYDVNFVDEKIDVYSLGNIFYKLIENERKYNDISSNASRRLILNGHVPQVIRKDGVDVALDKAMKMCLQVDPTKRSSAKEVYMFLSNALNRIENSITFI